MSPRVRHRFVLTCPPAQRLGLWLLLHNQLERLLNHSDEKRVHKGVSSYLWYNSDRAEEPAILEQDNAQGADYPRSAQWVFGADVQTEETLLQSF